MKLSIGPSKPRKLNIGPSQGNGGGLASRQNQKIDKPSWKFNTWWKK